MKFLRFLFTSKEPQTEESFGISVNRLVLLSWIEDNISPEMSVLNCHTTLCHSCEGSDRGVTKCLKLLFWTAGIFLVLFQRCVSETSSYFLMSIRAKPTWLFWVFSTAIVKPSFVNNFMIQIKSSKLAFLLSYSFYEATEPKIRINSGF